LPPRAAMGAGPLRLSLFGRLCQAVPTRKKKSDSPKTNLLGGDMILRIHPKEVQRPRRLSTAGRWLTAIGVFLLGVYVGSIIYQVVSSRLALQDFDEARAMVSSGYPKTPIRSRADPPLDFRLWAPERILAYNQDPGVKKKGSPLAVLRFEKLNLRVPVFEGTDYWTLNRGAGWIKGSARPGETGNVGIAGHRDSFFRVLKDASKGDAIELDSAASTATFTVDEIEIVDPEEVAVLQPRTAPSLTLVTCYPFYFVGEAPQRFIVHAALSRQVEIKEF
jgi:sortase A